MDERTDLELLKALAAGDRQAFESLLKRHQTPIFKLICRYVRDRELAEDLCQETFLRVWKHAAGFKGRSEVGTWLYRMAVNVCLNHRESCKSRPSAQSLCDDVPADCSPPGDDMLVSRREMLMRQALDALPERQRMAIILVSFSGHSYEQVAEIMDVSIASVESLLFRARQNLAAYLKPYKKKGEL